MRAHGKAGDWD